LFTGACLSSNTSSNLNMDRPPIRAVVAHREVWSAPGPHNEAIRISTARKGLSRG
jgi:hypothetical protein